jgi:hypothetical protein
MNIFLEVHDKLRILISVSFLKILCCELGRQIRLAIVFRTLYLFEDATLRHRSLKRSTLGFILERADTLGYPFNTVEARGPFPIEARENRRKSF